jgi:hypothetical protein
VPADYEKIRADNIDRYGWDTAVLDLLGQLYSDRTHFIFELIQNAEDAGATELAFELFRDRLEVRHDGRPFTEDDVRGVCGIGKSAKSDNLTQIGKFGIGFKSVYAYTQAPRIYSGDERFQIDKYVRPSLIQPLDDLAAKTLFVFPFDHHDVPADAAVQEISAAFNHLGLGPLLFLRNISRIRVRGARLAAADLERETGSGIGSSRRVGLADRRAYGRGDQEWFVWSRRSGPDADPAHRVEIAFRADRDKDGLRLAASASSPLSVFFPTAKETFLGFLIQGPYRTTPARDNIPEHDPSNQELVRETAALLTDVLTELRDEGLLTAEVLGAMPLDITRFEPGTMFRPVFDSARTALLEEDLIPRAGGGYRSGQTLRLARGAALRDLLTPDQLGKLYGTGQPLAFAHETITENRAPLLWRYLREQIGIDEITPESAVSRMTGDFLAAQPDDWMARFYAFLQQNPALWREPRIRGQQPGAARSKPIIRLEDGTHIAPFDARGLLAAYLPGTAATEFPTIRRAIADVPDARQFLEALKFTEPDVVAEVLDKILPRYRHPGAVAADPSRHDADIERIVRALAKAGAGRRKQLHEQLRSTAFLMAENAATGETQLMTPPAVYRRTDELQVYFEGNSCAWFAAERYRPWLDHLRELGVRDTVAVTTRYPDSLGHAVIVSEWGRHERGLYGFDPDADIDGLAFALTHPSSQKSEYVWNSLLVPNRHLIAGTVERSTRMDYTAATREEVESAIGIAATTAAWLPGPDGAFRHPSELMVDDLPPAFRRDEILANSLAMIQPVVEQASRQLGISSEVLLGLSRHPDLIEKLEQDLKGRIANTAQNFEPGEDTTPASGAFNYSAALVEVFARPASTLRGETLTDVPTGSGDVNNSELRRARVHAAISEGKSVEPPSTQRFRRITGRAWEAKDSAVRHFLLEQYDGHCQACGETFAKRDSTPYFEGMYLVGRTHGRWLDRPGNAVCLCATCCAKFRHGSVEALDIQEQITRWRTRQEGGTEPRITLRLCDQPIELRFTEKHLLDLQEIVKDDL